MSVDEHVDVALIMVAAVYRDERVSDRTSERATTWLLRRAWEESVAIADGVNERVGRGGARKDQGRVEGSVAGVGAQPEVERVNRALRRNKPTVMRYDRTRLGTVLRPG